MEILICVLLGVLFMISGVLWSKYDKERTKKFLETVPPIGKRYFVTEKEIDGKIYYSIHKTTFNLRDRTIDNYYVSHHDNSKMALEFRDKMNAIHLEEHKKTELEKSLKSLSNSVIID